MSDKTYEGACFCGEVAWTTTGEPMAMGMCHCADCRSWSASPVNAFILWKPEAFAVTKGADQIGSFNKTPGSERQWCKKCGGHIATIHPELGFVDVFAASIPTYPFAPGLHVHYAQSVLSLKDGLPKMKDMPAEMGGSGETLPE